MFLDCRTSNALCLYCSSSLLIQALRAPETLASGAGAVQGSFELPPVMGPMSFQPAPNNMNRLLLAAKLALLVVGVCAARATAAPPGGIERILRGVGLAGRGSWGLHRSPPGAGPGEDQVGGRPAGTLGVRVSV